MNGWQQMGRLIGDIGRRSDSVRRSIALVLVGIFLSFAIVACRGNPSGQQDIELLLIGYSVPKIAHDAIIPKFVQKWEKEHHGQSVIFSQSYGGSGSQTRAVVDGLDADIVHLAIGSDVNKLVQSGYVREDWNKRVPNNGIVGETVASITTREGNPKNITSFADLTRDDVKWVTPNPKTSGGARWNYYALRSYAKETPNIDSDAFTLKAFKNVAVLTKDAREATDAFVNQGQGDALVNYENEAILARQKGDKFDFATPEITISIDTPIAIVDKNVDKHKNREAAEAFVQFLFTPEAQREFAKVGFRPIGSISKEPEFVKQYPAVKQLVKISEFGGWKTAQKAFDDGGSFDKVESAMGKK